MHATLLPLIKTLRIFPFQANLMDPIPNLPPRKLRSNVSLQIQLPIYDDDLASDDYDYDGEMCNLDLFSSDEFRMYEFKVRRCTRARSHDWTDCPFAHPGEKARRRDPRKHHYSATVCPEYKSRAGHCPRGDGCEFAHGVFECWLHPARYRTTPCRDGKGCRRKVCFFAHTRKQLRVAPSSSQFLSPTSTLVGFGCCSSSVTSPESPTGAVGFGRSKSKREVFGELVGRLEAMQISPRPAAAAGLMPAVSESGDGGGGCANPSWYAPDFEWVDELLEQG